MSNTNQCFHCGYVFDDATFEGHIKKVARSARPAQIEEWLLRWAIEFGYGSSR